MRCKMQRDKKMQLRREASHPRWEQGVEGIYDSWEDSSWIYFDIKNI